MFRMLLEITMVFALLGGAFYVNNAMAKESRENKKRAKERLDRDDPAST